MKQIFGGLEGGGTKFVCVVGNSPERIVDEVRFPTTTPKETLQKAIGFFESHSLTAIGLASFGPLDLHPESSTYGHILSTPKPGWSHTDILGAFRRRFNIPVAFDLDVNAAAFGEFHLVENNRHLDSLVYFTIGTGIGAGIISNQVLTRGLQHPEVGHIYIPHDLLADPFPGMCPFHGDCLEGLASGPAVEERWGQKGAHLSSDHPAWELEATYIAYALCNTILTISPQRIILGGGVMQQDHLFPLVRNKVKKFLNGYIDSPVFSGTLEYFIVPPALGTRSGVLGALEMARNLTSELHTKVI